MTSTALIGGLAAADATKPVVVSALLIAALADNLTDSLSIHIYQESGRLREKEALSGTLTNFLARLLLCISFVLLIGAFPLARATTVAFIWGVVLLSGLTWLVARERGLKPLPEILKHLLAAAVVVALSVVIGYAMSKGLS